MQLFRLQNCKNRILILGLALSLPVLGQREEALEPQLRISRVEVFTSQSIVRREGSIDLRKGENSILIKDLPTSLFNETVRMGISSPGVRIRGFETEEIYKEQFLSREAKEAKELLEHAQQTLESLTIQYQNLQKEESNLKAIQIAPPAKDPKLARRRKIDTKRWKETLDFIQTSLEKNHSAQSDLLTQIDTAREELNVALVLYEKYSESRSVSRKQIQMIVESPSNLNAAKLWIEYRVGDSGWYPIYSSTVSDVSANPKKVEVELQAFALVRNETGENWKDVNLLFSAAEIDSSSDLPRLPEWRIQYSLVETDESKTRRESKVSADAAPRKKYAAAPQKAMPPRIQEEQQMAASQSYQSQQFLEKNQRQISNRKAAIKSQKMESTLGELQRNLKNQKVAKSNQNYRSLAENSEKVVQTIQSLDPKYQRYFREEVAESNRLRSKALEMIQVDELLSSLVPPNRNKRGFNVQYASKSKESIPSEIGFSKVFLFRKNLEADLGYEASPLKQSNAFLTGTIKYSDSLPLLSGPNSVFHGRDYLGQSVLPFVAERDRFALHLGASQDIQISRREEEKKESNGIFSKSYASQKEVTITVRNRKKTSVGLDLFERYPVSQDERIEILNLHLEPTPVAEKKDYGLVRFHLDLGPGETQKVKFGYTVRQSENVLPVFIESGGPKW